jgi:hypothetical protein
MRSSICDRRRPESLDDARAICVVRRLRHRPRLLGAWLVGFQPREKVVAAERRQRLDHVRRRGRDGRPLFQEIVRAMTARIERRPGNGKDQPAEIGGIARSDQ